MLELKKTNKREIPPLLYDLTSLQQDANKLYGYSAKQTLNIVQQLYEQHKYLTYPRTDSKYLSSDMYNTIKERLINSTYGEYSKYANLIIKNGITNSKRIFDNSKVNDHHAIIPTEMKCIINSLDTEEANIYTLVLKRFLAVFMDDYEYLTYSIIIGNDKYQFRQTFSETVNMGWKSIYNKDENIVTIVNKINNGMSVDSFSISYKESKTTPPERYTEATLLYAMEHAGKYTNNKLEQQALEDSSGIGTPATRAEIIERIFSAGYVKLVGKSIHPTDKGMQLIELVPQPLRQVSLTAKQELSLEQISKGKLYKDGFIKDIINFTKELTSEVMNSTNKYQHDNMTAKKCPECGKPLLDLTNKFGKSLACIDKECGYKKTIYKISNLRCPTCHHQLKQVGDKESGFFQCDCGFKEKCESFFNHLKDSKQGMNKKDLRKYIEKQDKEVPKNNPFTDLFKNE